MRAHFRRGALALLLAGLALAPPALVAAPLSDDLAALARKEKARRAALTKPAKVYTETDRGEGAPAKPSSPDPAASATPARTVAVPESTAGLEASWRTRAQRVREALAAAEKALAQMEKEFVTFRSDLTQVSAAEAQDPLRLQKRDQKIAEMNKQIEAQKAAVSEARKAIVNFEDEARRAGVPAGWLR